MKAHNVRLANQRLILDHLQRHDLSTKASIAEACGLSKPTAGKIIDDFIEAGVVTNTNAVATEHALGRPGQMLALDSQSARYVLIELSARSIVFRLASISGDSLNDQEYKAPQSANEFISLCKKWKKEHAPNTLWACALSVPGVVDEAKNKVIKSPNLPWTEESAWYEQICNVFACSVAMVQEIRALALAHVHTKNSPENFLFIYNGEGLGGALVIDEQLFKGAGALSVEIGHTPIDGNDRQCGCGNKGCLETLIAEPALLKEYQVKNWSDCVEAIQKSSHALDEKIPAFAKHIASAANISGADHVVLAGNINDWPHDTKKDLEARIGKQCMYSQFGTMNIHYSQVTFQRGLVAYLCDYFLATTMNWEKPCQQQVA